MDRSTCLTRIILIIIVGIENVLGIKWRDCFGKCRKSRRVRDVPGASSYQCPESFMNINQSTPWHSSSEHVSQSNAIVLRDLSYQSCQTIVDNVLWTARRMDDQVRDQLVRKCMRRWHELSRSSLNDAQV